MIDSPTAPNDRRTLLEKLLSLGLVAPMLALLLGVIGTVSLYSVVGGSMEPFAMRHVGRLVIGFSLVMAMAVLPMRLWIGLAYPVYAAALALLALVLTHGTTVAGAQRWISLGGIGLQPSELMKVAVILAVARYYQSLPAGKISSPLYVAIPLALVALPTALVMKQPDLGTAILVAAIGLSLIYLAGVSLFYPILGIVGAVAAAPVVWNRLHDYQKERVLNFLEPDADPMGAGYQVYQSKIALGSGGLWGKGLTNGTQSQLDFVPENHTDFVFALIAEETGFVGSLVVFGLFALLIVWLIHMALRTRSMFARLVTAGAAVSLFLHMFINIAMVMGAAPVVGVPLPLVSYGGTSLFATLMSLGIALNAFVHRDLALTDRQVGWLI
ncbi:MAG: rod shape-determining protein RodA [Hyphomicrobiaceae bacterium]